MNTLQREREGETEKKIDREGQREGEETRKGVEKERREEMGDR